MSLRATGRAAEDLLTLIRALKDPTELEGHLERIATGSTKLAQDIDAVKAREDAVTAREAAAAAYYDRLMQVGDEVGQQKRSLDNREAMLVGQVQNLEVAVRNHSAVVSDFEDQVKIHQEEVARRHALAAAVQVQMDKAFEEHAVRKQALDDREAHLNGIEAALNERAKRIAEAVR